MGDLVYSRVVISEEAKGRGWTVMSEYSQGVEERENPDTVPGTNTSGRHNRTE